MANFQVPYFVVANRDELTHLSVTVAVYKFIVLLYLLVAAHDGRDYVHLKTKAQSRDIFDLPHN